MNEEEKKAIEGLFHLAHINTYLDLEKNVVIKISRPIIERWKDETKILLNLIEKQQKEIKTRLKEIDSLYKMMSVKDDEIEKLKEDYQILKDDIEGHNITYVDTPEFEENYISKDKIKEIKEKYRDDYMTININNRSAGKTFKQAVYYEVRKVIDELLGE